MLIKTFFKRRESWWAITDRIDEANFVWTQIKVNYLHNAQKICKQVSSIFKQIRVINNWARKERDPIQKECENIK